MLLSTLALAALALPLQTGDEDLLRADGWLVLDAVDGRGRRPFRPDAVFAEYLAGAEPSFPIDGQRLTGERGSAAWRWVEAADDGGPAETGAWAAALIDVPPGAAGVYRARLAGAWELYVDGRPFVGDAYRYGDGGVPVVLEEGLNTVLVAGARGGFALAFAPADGPVAIDARGVTRPDLVVGEGGAVELGVTLHRTSREPLAGARLIVAGALEAEVTLAPLAPLETRVVAVTARLADATLTAQPGELEFSIRVAPAEGGDGALAHGASTVRIVEPAARRLRSFRSGIDGSTQVFGEVPPPAVEGSPPAGDVPSLNGLVLSLHGAGVAPRNQIGAYAPEPGLWIVAPTNRRPYGFDWQDWGRTDAYEVLDAFRSRVAIDPTRIYLTGHSMGGHGTWHLAANDPDQWAAIAPSAAWRSFDTYGGRPDGELVALWQRADAASLTEALIDNLAPLPTFVLHGDADSTVPVGEARAMVERMTAAGARDLRSHFQPGAGHWWDGDDAAGADCVQWRGIFELFAEHRRSLPTAADALVPSALAFTTVDPAVDSRHHWLAVEQALTIGRPASVAARVADGRLVLTTENVRWLALPAAAAALDVVVDGEALPAAAPRDAGAPAPFALVRSPGGWNRRPAASVPADERSPRRSGPFKRAFDREFVLVRGTAGTADETALLERLALRDAQAWWYRANGRAPVMTDRELLARPDLAHRNVILYGNSETNAAWFPVLGEDCPIQLRRGFALLGDEQHRGPDQAAVFCYPRRGSDVALAGVFADTGPAGARLHTLGMHFVSGVGLPDYALFTTAVLTGGDEGVSVAGFFTHDWQIDRANWSR